MKHVVLYNMSNTGDMQKIFCKNLLNTHKRRWSTATGRIFVLFCSRSNEKILNKRKINIYFTGAGRS